MERNMVMENELIEASPALIAVPGNNSDKPLGKVGVYDYLRKSFAYVSTAAFYWFDYFETAKTWMQAVSHHSSLSERELEGEIQDLIQHGFLVTQSDPAFLSNKLFRESWKWDKTTALFHFTLTDNIYDTSEQAVASQLEKAKTETPPALFWGNKTPSRVLPPPHTTRSSQLLEVMGLRRTNRTSFGGAISLENLADCLFAGLGITGYVDTPTGNLPLSMTPSGGARNPFEAFVFARRCEGLEPGAYHYSAVQHTLQKIPAAMPDDLSSLVANQQWINDMAIVIVLVGVLDRTWWKYVDPNAYRVIMIEAGHIAQNMMVVAGSLGLSMCPTAALAHSPMSQALNLEGLEQIPVYALTLDRPKPYPDRVTVNPVFVQQESRHLV
jgi:SagB-type dehydrogenase family enzyme